MQTMEEEEEEEEAPQLRGQTGAERAPLVKPLTLWGILEEKKNFFSFLSLARSEFIYCFCHRNKCLCL